MQKKNKGGRPPGKSTRCGGRWTEAKYTSFIMSNLRNSSRKWAVNTDVLKEARVRRGFYLCAGCKEEVPATIIKDGRKRNNNNVDHIVPVIDPTKGFVSWDDAIARLFSEKDNLQVLCWDCHKIKSDKEKAIGAERRKKEKEDEANNSNT